MKNKVQDGKDYDIFVIGGGVNGAAILRDAAGRGYKCGLAEMGDFGSATSSSSTKLFHGGLRYLESYQFRLVKESLRERDLLLNLMPHISWPLQFILPHNKNLRPYWILRLGLYIYDFLAGSTKLPKSASVDLRNNSAGKCLHHSYKRALAYTDCWVEDSRLVLLNILDAEKRGAKAFSYSKVTHVQRKNGQWLISINSSEGAFKVKTKVLINTMGPWVNSFSQLEKSKKSQSIVRLVKGSHIVVKKLFNHDSAYIFQGKDRRIIFSIPYEKDFTLIGTTEVEHKEGDEVKCSIEEKKYLCDFASNYFQKKITIKDIVWDYSGVRALYENKNVEARNASRDYMFELEEKEGSVLLTVYGGKITTHRKLAEKAVSKITSLLKLKRKDWTSTQYLPGGDFKLEDKEDIIRGLLKKYKFLNMRWAERLFKTFGSDLEKVLGGAKTKKDLGKNFGFDLTEREVLWYINHEHVTCVEDLIWRRSKLGLRLSTKQIKELHSYITNLN